MRAGLRGQHRQGAWHRGEVARRGRGGSCAGGGAGGGCEDEALELPTALDLTRLKLFSPKAPGASLRHERQTGRVRASCIAGGATTSRPSLVREDADKATRWCLRWQWAQHEAATGEASPWPELRVEA